MSKTASRTRSEVGRSVVPAGARNRRPRRSPAITRTEPAYRRALPAPRHPRRPPGFGRRAPSSALEQELGLLVVEEETQLLCQERVIGEVRVGADELHRQPAGVDDQTPVGQEPRQPEVGAAFLARSEDGPFPPEVEVHVGEGEPVRALLERAEAGGCLRCLAPREPGAPGPLPPPA